MKNFKLQISLIRYNRYRNDKQHFCKAPYASLFLDYKGNVFPCFVNKHYSLGNYIHQSIQEIWKGQGVKDLRKSLNVYNFSLGCHLCKHKLLEHKFSQVYARRYDYLTIEKADYPTSIELQLSNQCNLNCIMCVVTKDAPSTVDISKLREHLKSIIPYLKNASFSGGEPFFINEYFNIWEDFIEYNNNCKISVNTNATIVNDRIKTILENLDFNISVSIDGFSKKVFESIRLGSNRDVVFKNMHFFREYTQRKNTFFNVKVCALKQNIEEFPQLFDYFNKHDISIVLNEVVYPLNVALWNYPSSRIKEISTFLSKQTPFFGKTPSQINNEQVWKELLLLLNTYYKKARLFEEKIIDNKKIPLEELKNKTIRKLTPLFLNKEELQYFLYMIEKFASNNHHIKTLYSFFLVAPFDRMIGELEIRNEQEQKLIVNHIISNFAWLL